MGLERGGVGLIRHAFTEQNRNNFVQGLTDNPASAEGLAATMQFATSLSEEGFCFDRVYSSALQRTIETAEVFQDVLGIASHFVEPYFNERSQGDLEGLTFEEADALELEPGTDTGEDRGEFKKRVVDAYQKIKEMEVGRSILLVVHSATIKAIIESEGYPLEGRRVPHETLFFFSSEGQFTTIR